MYIGWEKGQEVVARGLLAVHGFAPQIICLGGEHRVSGMQSLVHVVVDHKPVLGKLAFCLVPGNMEGMEGEVLPLGCHPRRPVQGPDTIRSSSFGNSRIYVLLPTACRTDLVRKTAAGTA